MIQQSQTHVFCPCVFVPWSTELIPVGSDLLFPWVKPSMLLCPASQILNTQRESGKLMTSEGPEGGHTQTPHSKASKHVQYTWSSQETGRRLYLSYKWCDESSNTRHPAACTNANSPSCCGENLRRPKQEKKKWHFTVQYKYSKLLCDEASPQVYKHMQSASLHWYWSEQ